MRSPKYSRRKNPFYCLTSHGGDNRLNGLIVRRHPGDVHPATSKMG